jgi:carboxyl-terminal processing protease
MKGLQGTRIVTALGALAFPANFAAGPTSPAPADKAEHFAGDAFKIISIIHEQHVKRPALAVLVRWAVEGLYRETGETIPSGIADRLNGVAALDSAGMKRLLTAARAGIKDEPANNGSWDIYAAAAGIFRQLEPNSDPKSWLIQRGELVSVLKPFHGIGLELAIDERDQSVRVVTPIYGGPAYRAGVRAGDRILRIVEERPGEPAREKDPRGLPLEAVTFALRGPERAIFHLHLERPDGTKAVVDVRPGKSGIETVLGVERDANDRWRYTMLNEQAIGYIRIKKFGSNTGKELNEVLTNHKDVAGWVIDLRFNEGGVLSSAFQAAELFVGTRRIVTAYAGPDNPRAFALDGDELAAINERPVICLVNGKTQGTAEIVAACLQDQGKALIVGQRTAGRADIHNFRGVLDGAMELKLTGAVFVRPNGRFLSRYMSSGRWGDDWGVRPDAGMDCRLSHEETEQLVAAFRNSEAIYAPGFRVSTTVVDRQLDLAMSAIRARIRDQ